MKPAQPKARRSLPLVEARSCGPCHACCVVFRIDEPAAAKEAHERCGHLATSSKGGRCAIYSDRPKTCRDFECLWLRGAGGPDDRPDLRGVVLHEIEHSLEHTAIVVVTECVDGAMEEGTPGAEIAHSIGFQTHVLMMFKDGRRRAIVPAPGR